VNGDLLECMDCPDAYLTALVISILWVLWATGAVLRVVKLQVHSRVLRTLAGAFQWVFFVIASLLSAAWLRSPFI